MSNTEPGSRVGSRFGPYRLERLLGQGIVGEVYEAEDTRNDQTVALKLISDALSGDEAFRTRLEDEAEAAGQLTEPHVVPVHAYGEIDDLLYLEMGLIDGTDLATLLKKSGPLSSPRAVAIVRQVAAALDAAHDADVTHRDVKPANILVTGDDTAYLTDFGIAAAAADVESEPETPEAPETPETPEIAEGTYDYLAPERLTGDQATHLADVYSLACVLAECLTGSAPYPADSREDALSERLTAPPPRASKLRPGRVPAAVDEVLTRGLSKKPEDRYSSAGELARAAYAALTEPEQHQVTRILRRGEAGTALVVGTETGSEPRAETPPHPVQVDFTRPGWTPPDADHGAFSTLPASPFPTATLRNPDLTPEPLRMPVPSRPRFQRKPILVVAAVLAALMVFVTVGRVVTRASSASPVASPPQSVLPFTDLDYRLSPGGVALDGDGNVYVTSEGMHGRVVKLDAGSLTSTVLPFSDLYQPRGVVVDSAGNVYFSDVNNRVVKVVAESNTQVVLPFVGLDNPDGLAVDSAGDIYVADRGNNVVLKMEAGSNVESTLPFIGLNNPDGVAVDNAGNVYVTDTDNNQVVKLTAGSNEQVVLPFTGIVSPWGIAVDDAGAVYVTEHKGNKVVKLAAGAAIPVVLPFTGLNAPLDVAVDKHGDVYVADRGNDRVVKVSGS